MGLDKSNGKKPEHPKTINNVRNNSEKLQTDRWTNGAKANKDSVIVVVDLMIKHVNALDDQLMIYWITWFSGFFFLFKRCAQGKKFSVTSL